MQIVKKDQSLDGLAIPSTLTLGTLPIGDPSPASAKFCIGEEVKLQGKQKFYFK